MPIWSKAAKKVFNHTKESAFVQRKGIYDKIIIDCAFRESLLRKKGPSPNGGCEGFQPSITTNGMCHTFNGKPSSNLWKSSEMITTFTNLFPQHNKTNKTFGGSGSVQGN